MKQCFSLRIASSLGYRIMKNKINYKTKWSIILGITIPLSAILFIIGCFFLIFYEPPQSKQNRIDYYTNDDNYKQFYGIIANYNLRIEGNEKKEKVTLSFEFEHAIKVDSNESFENVTLSVFSENIRGVWDKLEPPVGKEIIFISPRIRSYAPGWVAPIVQITYEDEEILSFEDGKAALLAHYSD